MTDRQRVIADQLERAIAPHREPLSRILATLEPLEAITLLGMLVAETINRFPTAERGHTLAALWNTLVTPDQADDKGTATQGPRS